MVKLPITMPGIRFGPFGSKKKNNSTPAPSSGKPPFALGPRAEVARINAEADRLTKGPEIGPYRDPSTPYEPTDPTSPGSSGGGGRGGGGGGYAAPVFDTSAFDAARARISSQSDAAKKLIAQMQAELAARLNEHAAAYAQAAQKVQADMQAQGQQAAQTNTSDLQAVQRDLANQGANVQAVAAQAQAQEQARAQAQARQQDYMARLSQLAAQNTADRNANAGTMFAGLNSQAELQKNSQLSAIDAEQMKAMQAFQQALRGGGGGGGGGRGRSSGGGSDGGDGFDPTQSQVWSMNNKFVWNENDPQNRLEQVIGLGVTPYAQRLAEIALTQNPGVAMAQWLRDKAAYDSGQRNVFGPNWNSPRAYAQNVDDVLNQARQYWTNNNYIVNAPTRQSQLASYNQLVRGPSGSSGTTMRRNPRR